MQPVWCSLECARYGYVAAHHLFSTKFYNRSDSGGYEFIMQNCQRFTFGFPQKLFSLTLDEAGDKIFLFGAFAALSFWCPLWLVDYRFLARRLCVVWAEYEAPVQFYGYLRWQYLMEASQGSAVEVFAELRILWYWCKHRSGYFQNLTSHKCRLPTKSILAMTRRDGVKVRPSRKPSP